MKRKKRVEAWVVRGHGGQSQIAIAYRHAETARGQAETWADESPDEGPYSVHRLVECGPDEVPMSKRAAAVVRAAVTWASNPPTDTNEYDGALLRAVERYLKAKKGGGK
jgi:hypothetical protein